MLGNIKKIIYSEIKDYQAILRNVPSMVFAVFVVSVILMNLLSNKELYRSDYICINTGLALSWISFLCMDCICKRFGGRAAIKINIVAILINVIVVVVFYLLMLFPGKWAAMYAANDVAIEQAINDALNATFAGTWYVVAGSAFAMFISGVVNAVVNIKIGKMIDNGTYKGFAVRSFVSTAVAQWVDNFVFSALVSHIFFQWNWMQVLICATTSMILELGMEVIFSPIGYKIAKRWERDNVGQDYIEFEEGKHAA